MTDADPRVSRRGPSWWALLCLSSLYALCLWAPLIANDRPLWFEGRDATGLQRALDSLRALALRGESSAMDAALAELERECEDPAPWIQARQAVDAARLKAVERALATPSVARSRAHSPAWESLSRSERVGVVLGLWLALWPLWWRRRLWMYTLAALTLLAALSSPVLRWSAPGEFKRGWSSARIEAQRWVMAPIPFSPAELNPAEAWRAPTWWSSSFIDEHGVRADSPPVDPGEWRPLPMAWEPLMGEPPRNAWYRHLCGTDAQGRDLAARILHGARTSLVTGFLAALCATLIGSLLGLWAGMRGAQVDAWVLRAMEVVACVPALLVILLAMAIADPALESAWAWIVVVLVGLGWPSSARLVRAQVLRVREAEFVHAARALGSSEWRIAWRHILPNVWQPVLVSFGFAVGSAMLLESTVSFLGVGLREPQASLGALVNASYEHAWAAWFPGIALVLLLIVWHWVAEEWRARWSAQGVGAR